VPGIASISYTLIRIFASNGSHEPARSSKMAHYLDPTSDDKYRGLPCGNEGETHPGGYRFGRSQVRSGQVKSGHVRSSHGRSALNRLKGYLKTLIEAIANAKLRRMRCELELRGIRLDQSDEAWIASSLRDTSRAE